MMKISPKGGEDDEGGAGRGAGATPSSFNLIVNRPVWQDAMPLFDQIKRILDHLHHSIDLFSGTGGIGSAKPGPDPSSRKPLRDSLKIHILPGRTDQKI